MTKAEYMKRYVAEMVDIIGEFEPYFEFAAREAWELVKDYPDDMCPEEAANEEYSEWVT
jgi:hypothetical protein